LEQSREPNPATSALDTMANPWPESFRNGEPRLGMSRCGKSSQGEPLLAFGFFPEAVLIPLLSTEPKRKRPLDRADPSGRYLVVGAGSVRALPRIASAYEHKWVVYS
jgi:hypothetical protein